jgi:8-oxo-dGTP diphosphatase
MKQVAVGIILRRDGMVLACQRLDSGKYPLKWEFPGGKIEPGETGEEALVRELREELSIEAVVDREFFRQEWTYRDSVSAANTDGSFRITYFLVTSFTGEPVNNVFQSLRWVTPADFLEMDILEGNRAAIELLVRHAREGHEAA